MPGARTPDAGCGSGTAGRDAAGLLSPAGQGASGAQASAGVLPVAAALFLDIDGTLLPLAETPRSVVVDAAVLELIGTLHGRLQGALALVSGRTVEDVDRLFSPLRLPVGGQHGLERRGAQVGLDRFSPPGSDLVTIRAWLAELRGAYPELLIEDKGLSFAVHFRRAPALAQVVADASLRLLGKLGEGWKAQPGKMVVEVKPSGRDKGSAISAFMAEAPFRGRVPVFMGDDATDEHGFAAVNAMGGVSIRVGQGETVAHWRIPDVGGVRAWLRACLPD